MLPLTKGESANKQAELRKYVGKYGRESSQLRVEFDRIEEENG